MGDKAPAYQWYPKDYESDEAVKLMTYEQEGIYRRLLDHQALHGGIPADVQEIAILVPKVPARRFLALWPRIAGKFKLVDGRLVNEKLEKVKASTAAFKAARVEGGRNSAASRRRTNGTAQPNNARTEHRTELRTEPRTRDGTSVEAATASAEREIQIADAVLERARNFIERYPQIYAQERGGARYPVKEARDFPTFLTLVQTWTDDERLDGMFRVFLHLKGRDVLNQPGSPGQFLHHAPECDQLLRANGR